MNADKRQFGKIICLLCFTTGLVFGQEFEVASVKPNTGRGQATMTSLPGGERLVARNMPLVWLIGEAYLVPNRQISGLPDGMGTENYDIEAKAGRPVSRAQMVVMLRSLLEERFRLVVRRETKELNTHVLVVAKGGVKMDENRDGGELAMRKINGNKMSYHNIPMSLFANVMAGAVDDTVVDGTGLKGNYDFTLEYYSGPGGVGVKEGREAAPDPNGSSLQTALREQLGLRLESRKGPVEMLMVEHIERLSGN
jgi:bla regulator protein blaR1